MLGIYHYFIFYLEYSKMTQQHLEDHQTFQNSLTPKMIHQISNFSIDWTHSIVSCQTSLGLITLSLAYFFSILPQKPPTLCSSDLRASAQFQKKEFEHRGILLIFIL